MTSIAIIGGGISGLAAAYELARREIPFTLFEATDRLGGLVRTEHLDSFTIETGADSMLASKRAGLDLCDELGLTPRLLTMKKPRGAYVLHRGRLHPLPTPSVFGIPGRWRDLARYSLLSPPARARVALEPLIPPRTATDDESVAAFFHRRFGRGTIRTLAQPLLGGIHAGDVEALSSRAVVSRLVDVERGGRSVLLWIRRTAGSGGNAGAFRSMMAGMGELVDAIHGRLPPRAVRCGVPVVGVRQVDGGWQVSAVATAATFGAVVFASPAHVVARLLDAVNSAAGVICRTIPYVSTVSIALAWPRRAIAHPLLGSGFVVARTPGTGRLTACTWVTSKWSGRAPPDHVLLRAYVGGAHDQQAVELSDAELSEMAVRELSAILSITGPPMLIHVHRWRDAGAQHTVGHADKIVAIERHLASTPGLFVTGSGFRAIGIPDCIADGRAVAAAAANYIHAY